MPQRLVKGVIISGRRYDPRDAESLQRLSANTEVAKADRKALKARGLLISTEPVPPPDLLPDEPEETETAPPAAPPTEETPEDEDETGEGDETADEEPEEEGLQLGSTERASSPPAGAFSSRKSRSKAS